MIVAAIFGSLGFFGGRVTAPVEIHFVPAPAITDEAASAPLAESKPFKHPYSVPPTVDAKPLPPPKVVAKPQPKPEKAPVAKPRRAPAPAKRALPSCAIVKREYERMSWAQQVDAYRRSTAEEVAHGKRCLGFS